MSIRNAGKPVICVALRLEVAGVAVPVDYPGGVDGLVAECGGDVE